MADPHAAVAMRVLGFRNLVEPAAAKYGVVPELVLAQIHDESGGDPDTFPEDPDRDGASFGLMQVELPTARSLGYSGPARLLFDPKTSITLGTQYLASLVKEYTNPWLALVGYNGGPGAVWRCQHGLKFGAAVHYANTVWALRGYYAVKLLSLKNTPPA